MKIEKIPVALSKLKKQGRHAVGNGLYLQISKWDTRAWVYRYQINGRRREMGLGSAKIISQANAMKAAKANKELVRLGIDPKVRQDAEIHDNQHRQSWTFDRCASAYIDSHKASWSNEKHIDQWRNTLSQYASPVFGKLPVEEINTAMIMRVVEPIWLTKTETASRVRARIERVLSWAIVQNYRDHPNPAIWRGNISELLPDRNTVANQKHHEALAYKELALFLNELDTHDAISAKALKFTILTACRTGDVIEASWDEIDIKERVWTIPKGRMKSKRIHRVPLTNELVELLDGLPKDSGWLFPSNRKGKHISNIAMLKFLKKNLNRPDVTVHGFRSTFRDWSAEISPYPRELAEAALAHVLANKTEAAYQRGDLLEKRREMMQAYSEYAYNLDDEIISMIGVKK